MRSRLGHVVAVVVLALLTSAPAQAAFHFAVIDEFMSGLNGDPSIQFVEIRLLQASQTEVQDTRLAAFSCDGSSVNRLILVPTGVSNGMAGARWIIGSQNFQGAACMEPDFVMVPFTTQNPGIFPNCGMICWGAPGNTLPPDPASWDPTNPTNYVDCVAYGPYTGSINPSAGPILSSTPNNGSQSLTRDAGVGFDNDFSLAAPTPTKNDGETSSFPGGCSTTTSTTPGGGGATTTSTTTGGGGGSTTSTTVGPALSGGGSKKTDCLGEWRVAGATSTKPVVTCADNDTTCDRNAAAGCLVRAQLCFNDAADPLYQGKCAAGAVSAFALTGSVDPENSGPIGLALAGLPGAAASGTSATFATPLAGAACSAPIDLTVPLTVKGSKTKKGVRTFKSATTASKKDKDKLKIICVP